MITKKVKIRKDFVAAIAVLVVIATACSGNSTAQDDEGSEAHLVRVPDLRGYSIEALTHEFGNLGFTPSLIRLVSDEPMGTVLFIERIGEFVQVPTTIEVHVSGGLPDWESEDPPTDEPLTQRQGFERMEFGGIAWLMLEEEEGKVLLLSEFVLFDMQYNDQLVTTTWEISTLRSYLNNEFFNSFAPEKRERIAETRILNEERQYTFPFGDIGFGSQSWPVHAGNDTNDRIFLLSFDEQSSYFANDAARRARLAVDHPMHGSGYDHWWWWLRSPGGCTFTAALVATIGTDIAVYPVIESIGVRPALWLYVG